jgi:hypothetical protein
MDTVTCLASDAESKKTISISIGIADHHGKWIAPALTELAAKHITNCRYPVKVVHYDLLPMKPIDVPF